MSRLPLWAVGAVFLCGLGWNLSQKPPLQSRCWDTSPIPHFLKATPWEDNSPPPSFLRCTCWGRTNSHGAKGWRRALSQQTDGQGGERGAEG